MLLISYLAHDTQYLDAVRERLSLAQPPMALVVARSVPELVHQVQALPVRLALVDLDWPRDIQEQLAATLRVLRPDFPVLALAPVLSHTEWWTFAGDLLRLDEPLDLFHFRLAQKCGAPASTPAAAPPAAGQPALNDPPSLLTMPQFRQFAEVFSGMSEPQLTDAFVGWVQQACQTSRAVLLLRDPDTGTFTCRAQRGLPSALLPHCSFAQTAPLCHWLTASGRILLRDEADGTATDVRADLDVLQAVAAVPIMFDGQLVGILGIGPRLAGRSYSTTELEALFALGGQMAAAVHHCQMHRTLRTQQEMTEHMLSVMPAGILVLGDDERIAFVNPAAAALLGKPCSALAGMDLRTLPAPLGDFAYDALRERTELPRREIDSAILPHPIAVSVSPLATKPPSAMLLMEDLSAKKQLAEEHGRRVDLEMLTNLVHYLAHELRNPLVALSTFSSMAPSQADDPDFKEFCTSVLGVEIQRVNLILEQLLVLSNQIELQFRPTELARIIDRVTGTEEMRAAVVVSLPVSLPELSADSHRIETALSCILRTATRLAYQHTPVTMKVTANDTAIDIHLETPVDPNVTPELLLNPWDQLARQKEEEVDLGLATAHYIIEQHQGTLTAAVRHNILVIFCRLPLHSAPLDTEQEELHDTPQGTHRR